MGHKIVLKNEIDHQIVSMNGLSQELNGNSDSIRASLSSLANSFRRSGGKSTIVTACMNTTSAINDVSASLGEGARLLELSKSTYRNLDSVLRTELNNTEFPGLNGLSFGENASNQVVFDIEKLKNTDGFRQSEPWGDVYVGTYKGQPINGRQCYAKAKQMQVEVMGSTTFQAMGSTNVNDIQVGDVVHYYYYDNGVRHQHWVFITGVKDGAFSIGEGNAWDGKQRGVVNYRDVDASEFFEIEGIYRV